MEDRFHDGLQVPLDDFLGNPVRDRRNPQWSGFCLAIALRTIDPPNRWRKVAPRSQSVAGSTMLRLWPTGSSSGLLPLIPTRWFSSSPSDPASRQTPCPPKIRRWRLQVSLSVSRLSPSCLTSLSIPFHHLRPVRHYPHLWISARGLGRSGTSTHLTRQLSGTHYGSVRPCAPHRYSGPCRFRRLDVSLCIGTTGSHVPHKSLIRLRAA